MKATTTITIEVKGTTLALTRDEARQLMQALQAEIGALPQQRKADPLALDPDDFFKKWKERDRGNRDAIAIGQFLNIPVGDRVVPADGRTVAPL